MRNTAVYLYSSEYRGLPKDCDTYKQLRIDYIKKYRDAIDTDNIWMEKHYFQKLLTCISYDNFPQYIVEGLYKVFRQRAEYLSWYYVQYCHGIEEDETFENDKQRSEYLRLSQYTFVTNDKQEYPNKHCFNDDFKRLFKKYQYNGFASKDDIARYKDCMYLFRYSSMEEDMIECFKMDHVNYTCQKTFPDLLSPKGKLLRFDGCVNKEGQILLIECQGAQHYMPVEFFGGEKTFKQQQMYDEIKKDYCKKNNIPLLCIRYNQNVYSTLRRFLARKTYKDIVYEYKK